MYVWLTSIDNLIAFNLVCSDHAICSIYILIAYEFE